jgi:DNA-directed RNA polymerase subunit RPC12/RpoP
MKVIEYECPDCGYGKKPTNHSRDTCNGIVIQVGNTWRCNACDKEITGDTKCARCGHNFGSIERGPNQHAVDMQL